MHTTVIIIIKHAVIVHTTVASPCSELVGQPQTLLLKNAVSILVITHSIVCAAAGQVLVVIEVGLAEQKASDRCR